MIIYTSRTGNVRYIVGELKLPSLELSKDLVTTQPYFLFTYTDGLGEVPNKVIEFLKNEVNQQNIKGIIATGNVNFGGLFCKSADIINNEFKVPIIRKIDLRGTSEDISEIRKQYKIYIEGE